MTHLHRDDFLYISYSNPIWVTKNKFGFREYHDYDAILFGRNIVEFVRAIQQVQTYDIESVAEMVKKKQRLFLQNHHEVYKFLFQSYLLEPL